MTSISGVKFQYNESAARLFQNISIGRNNSDDADAADKIITILHDAKNNSLFIDAPLDDMVIDTTDDDESDDPNVTIRTYERSSIQTGGGNDDVGTYNYSTVNSGSGDDHVTTYGYGNVNAGAGDDYVYGYSYMTVTAGDGNDEIRVSGYSRVNAGQGDDFVTVLGYSKVDGGSGDDELIAVDVTADHTSDQAGHATLLGGDGNDYIQIGRDSTAVGGAGDDTIVLMRAGSSVNFAAGDGKDKISAEDDFGLNLSGIGKDNISLSQDGDTVVVSFANSSDELRLVLREGKTATLHFENGEALTVAGKNQNTTMTYKYSSPEWRGAESYWEQAYDRKAMGYTTAEENLNGFLV